MSSSVRLVLFCPMLMLSLTPCCFHFHELKNLCQERGEYLLVGSGSVSHGLGLSRVQIRNGRSCRKRTDVLSVPCAERQFHGSVMVLSWFCQVVVIVDPDVSMLLDRVVVTDSLSVWTNVFCLSLLELVQTQHSVSVGRGGGRGEMG